MPAAYMKLYWAYLLFIHNNTIASDLHWYSHFIYEAKWDRVNCLRIFFKAVSRNVEAWVNFFVYQWSALYWTIMVITIWQYIISYFEMMVNKLHFILTKRQQQITRWEEV